MDLFIFLLMALTVISLNVNGLRNENRRLGFLQWLSHLSPSVVCLQETHAVSSADLQSWFSGFGFLCAGSFGSVHSRGVAVLYRPIFECRSVVCEFDGCFVLVDLAFRGAVFRVASIYAPNRNPDRDDFLVRCVNAIDPTVPTLLCGDFNTVLDRVADRRGSCPFDVSHESSVMLSGLFSDCCVVDIWRELHPGVSAFTWCRPDGALASRIDLIGCPYVWVPHVSSVDILPCPFSDHCALSFSWTLPDSVPVGPGLWKLNLAILEEDEYVSLITDFWFLWQRCQSDFSSLTRWWDAGKSHIKRLSINYCKIRNKSKCTERNILTKLAAHLKIHIDSGRLSFLPIYLSTLSRLDALDCEVARGAQVRSRARWAEEGESSTAYFFRLEKKRATDRYISALRADDGSLVTDKDGLCTLLRSFYLDLFTAVPCDSSARAELLSHISSVLPFDDSEACEGLLSQGECFAALQGMARGKAPGCDGLPMEFYLKFWDVLGNDLVLVLNSAYRLGSLSCSQRRGIITLTFKKGDRLDPKNWRPITLLNADYKIASRSVAARLLKVIHLIVSRDQTCGVPGRFIGENVAFLRDIVDFCTFTGVPAALLSLDQEKAFDRVDWSFLRSTLFALGFGQSFIGWVDLFYKNSSSAVNVNGNVSSCFLLSRGVRQGCPLSPLLYILIAEVLACNIRAHDAISGLRLPYAPVPLSCVSAYADDTTLVVTSTCAILAVFSVYSLYERGSGARLNMDKCKGLWLGSWNGRADSPVNISWSSIKVKVLGVFLGPGNLEEENWRPRITAVENALNSWRQRSLSYRGRALVINALALSRVWYVASLIHVPRWVIAELNTLIFKFFWRGKRDLVARRVVVQPFCLGGFSVVDFQCKVLALHVQWVRRFVSSPSSWVSFMVFWFSSVLAAPPHAVFSSPNDYPVDFLPPFYRSLLLAWRACKGSFQVSTLGIGSGIEFCPISSMTTRSSYLLLLSDNAVSPHCEVKFFPLFGSLYWSWTWRQLFFFDLDRPVIDLAWKVSHGVLYTAERLASFGYDLSTSCFCSDPIESLQHLFFYCPLAVSVFSWVQSLMFLASPLCPTLLLRHVLFGFSSDELSVVPKVFCYLLNVSKFYIWVARNDFRFRGKHPSAVNVMERVKSRVRFYLPLFFRRFRSDRRRRFFVRQWGARGVVASVRDKVLKVHI